MDKVWNVESVTSDKYTAVLPKPHIVYHSADFGRLNKNKVDTVEHLLIRKGESARFAMTVGIKDNIAYCPFSAPFGYPEQVKAEQGVQDFDDGLHAIEDYLIQRGIDGVVVTFPPFIYDETVLNTWLVSAVNRGWKICYADINFSLDLWGVTDGDTGYLTRNARKNLRISMDMGHVMIHCKSKMDCRKAYDIIRINREARGYPLRMSEEQVLSTIEIVPADMYLVMTGHEYSAAALVYDVTDDIAQVIYWGDKPGYTEKKVMNFLSYNLTMLYKKRGYHYLDIGPSSEYGVPNIGLCNFKDSIGCRRDVKYTLYKRYD